jgi:phytoene/squalene synthetase
VSSTALDSFLDKWRSRWPEWSVAAPFVAESQRELAVAWFALLQEFDDMLNTSGDPLPADAKLAWWGEELRSWAGIARAIRWAAAGAGACAVGAAGRGAAGSG